MNELDICWRDYTRMSMAAKIEEGEARRVSKKFDEIRSRTKTVSTKELVSWIREDREEGH